MKIFYKYMRNYIYINLILKRKILLYSVINIIMALANKKENYDWLIKLLLIGDSGVGKTNILLRFCENNFHNTHLTTIGNVSN